MKASKINKLKKRLPIQPILLSKFALAIACQVCWIRTHKLHIYEFAKRKKVHKNVSSWLYLYQSLWKRLWLALVTSTLQHYFFWTITTVTYNNEKFSSRRVVGQQRTVYYEITHQKLNLILSKTVSPSVTKAPLTLNHFFQERWPLYLLVVVVYIVPKKWEPAFTDKFNIW